MVNKAKLQSRKDGPGFLRGRLVDVEQQFRADLKRTKRAITHDGIFGDACERDWIELLKNYLPNRYSVAKAFAIDHKGKTTDSLDCLIYDAHFTPALFGQDNHLYIPAEAIYATFEIKQEVTADHLKYAAKKAKSLRCLKRTSAPITSNIGTQPGKPPFPILAGLLAVEAKWKNGLNAPAFMRQFKKLRDNEELNIVLTTNDGFCDQFNTDCSIEIATGEGSLIQGLFRLLSAITKKGTVTGIDWDKYEAVFSSSTNPS